VLSVRQVNVHIIYDGDNEEEAVKALKKKQNEKQRKGYVIVGDNGGTVQKKTMTE
jgi:predicted DNA-binding WGR domain protein